jgi:hypothetical protein
MVLLVVILKSSGGFGFFKRVDKILFFFSSFFFLFLVTVTFSFCVMLSFVFVFVRQLCRESSNDFSLFSSLSSLLFFFNYDTLLAFKSLSKKNSLMLFFFVRSILGFYVVHSLCLCLFNNHPRR